MSETGPARAVPIVEHAELEQAHHDLCTAMTIVRSRGELLRRGLRDWTDAGPLAAAEDHLLEIDKAVDRLHHVALALRTWRSGRVIQEA